MELTKYIACICEGTAEQTIMNLLLAAIVEYKRVSDVRRGEYTLADLLK